MKGQGKRFIRRLARERWGEMQTGEPPRIRGERDCTPQGHLALPYSLELRVYDAVSMPKDPFKTPASYEAAMEELDQLVGLIESGQLPLEQLLTGYERGARLLQFCRDKLQAVENQIKVLDEGALKPWTQE
jgi:exodeoxyribonuclease VII small subunit